MNNSGKKKFEILLGITGGIAAYKSAVLCSGLVKAGLGVTVAMTQHAQQFVGPLTFSTLTGRKVYTTMWDSNDFFDARHISLTDNIDLMVIAPATANIIAKAAHGICDDLLSTLIASYRGKIILAPAMNNRMYDNPANQDNLKTLRQRGYTMVGPESGRLACGTEGKGRMSEPETILEVIKKEFVVNTNDN